MTSEILNVQGLETQFSTPEGVVHAVNGVDFTLNEGETLGVVGESGCGKSVSMLSILRLIQQPPGKIVAGTAMFRGKDLLKMTSDEIRHVRGGQISMVFQDPMTSLNPVMTIGKQMAEPLMLHMGLSKEQARERSVELLEQVGIPRAKDRLKDYPHQYSGGMRQRVMIAMALSCNPQIVIADEPTTALDVTIQAQIVDLMIRLREEVGMSIVWITHDLGVVASIAHRVNVMYGGFIIEESPIRDLYANPCHPYTIGLLGSLPRIHQKGHQRLYSIEGMPPMLYQKPQRCPFSPRCRWVVDRCREENPPLVEVDEKHRVACWVDTTIGRER
ncbi:MAG TPA: ABC transporter ATP-binding protein [Anaerolineaceae bacterium]|jgi:oligopeptide transport system ATP-binding protein|nr:ABC transporter ATP-binding protein [Anaerolineaceae bacterium]